MTDAGELSDVVTGSVVDRDVIPINDQSDMIIFLSHIDVRQCCKWGFTLIRACTFNGKNTLVTSINYAINTNSILL